MLEGLENQGFGAFYIVSQVFALAAFICAMVAIQLKKKPHLLNAVTLGAFFSILHYAFLGAWPGMASKSITTVRNGLAAYESSKSRKSHKILPLIFVAFYIVMGIITYSSPISLLPILAPSIYAIVIYTCDVKIVRYTSVLTCVIWLIYDIFVFSIVGVLAQVIMIIDGLVAIWRYRKKPQTKKHQQNPTA